MTLLQRKVDFAQLALCYRPVDAAARESMKPGISNIAMRTRIPHRRFRGFRDDTAGHEEACEQAGKSEPTARFGEASIRLAHGLSMPSGQAEGMLFAKTGPNVGGHALLQRRAARSREWVDRSPVGDVSGDLVVLEGLQNAAGGGHARAVAHNR